MFMNVELLQLYHLFDIIDKSLLYNDMLALNIKEKQFLFLFLKQKVRQVLFDHQERILFTYKQI